MHKEERPGLRGEGGEKALARKKKCINKKERKTQKIRQPAFFKVIITISIIITKLSYSG